MNKKYQIRHITISAVFIAIGVYLPFLFHSVPNGGAIFLPMHLPAMLAAFFLPPAFACFIGFSTPILSFVLTGMPPLAPIPMAIILAFEISTYALIISLLRKIVFRRKHILSPLIAVVPALFVGRAISCGVIFVLLKFFGFDKLSPIKFVVGATTMGIVGIVAQIIFIPFLYKLLVKILPGWNGQERFLNKLHKKKEA